MPHSDSGPAVYACLPRRPFRPRQRHQDEINAAVVRQLKGLAQQAFLGKAVRRVYVTRPRIIDEYLEPEAAAGGLRESPVDNQTQELAAEASVRIRHRNALETEIAMGVIEVADDGKGGARTRGIRSEQVSMVRPGQRGEMFSLRPATDHLLETRQPFGRHDERKVALTREAQGDCVSFS